jgi:hypothetical protein
VAPPLIDDPPGLVGGKNPIYSPIMRAPRIAPASARPGRRLSAVALAAATALTAVAGRPAVAAPGRTAPASASSTLTVSPGPQGWTFRDGDGREVVLRGFNVSGSTKLYENGLLPFRDAADAARSAQAMRDQTGANAVRFLITWEGVQPEPGRIDHAYLDRAIEQMTAFLDRGFHVLLD